MARAHKYTPEIGEEILRRLAGGEFIKRICEDAHMPSRGVVYDWMTSNKPELKPFIDALPAARAAHSLALADDVVDIADDGSNDWMQKTNADGSTYEVVNHEHIARSKLRVDLRMKLASHHAPAMFGNNVGISGPGGAPIEIKDDPNQRDLARRLAFTLAAGYRIAKAEANKTIDVDADDVTDET